MTKSSKTHAMSSRKPLTMVSPRRCSTEVPRRTSSARCAAGRYRTFSRVGRHAGGLGDAGWSVRGGGGLEGCAQGCAGQ